MVSTHAVAVVQLLAAVPHLNVHDTTVPDLPTLPYVVVRVSAGVRTRSAIVAVSDTVTVDVWATSVGASREQAQWVAERVAAALLDARPAISGRASHPIELVASQPAQVDTDVNPPLVYAVDLYRLTTIPA